jgi:hypothetical protein
MSRFLSAGVLLFVGCAAALRFVSTTDNVSFSCFECAKTEIPLGQSLGYQMTWDCSESAWNSAFSSETPEERAARADAQRDACVAPQMTTKVTCTGVPCDVIYSASDGERLALAE